MLVGHEDNSVSFLLPASGDSNRVACVQDEGDDATRAVHYVDWPVADCFMACTRARTPGGDEVPADVYL